jgi:hypothetical protein
MLSSCDEDIEAVEDGITYSRSYYEGLIYLGKLRVVEEVDNYMKPSPISKEVFGCPNCQSVFHNRPRYSKGGHIRVIRFCPGCGNKVKR